MSRGWFKQVHSCYSRALKLDSENVDGLCGMAFLLDLNDDFKGAEKLLHRARKFESLATIDEHLGLVMAQQGRKAESLRFLRRSPHRRSTFVREAIAEINRGSWNPIED